LERSLSLPSNGRDFLRREMAWKTEERGGSLVGSQGSHGAPLDWNS
jgi:hypothetical protein